MRSIQRLCAGLAVAFGGLSLALLTPSIPRVNAEALQQGAGGRHCVVRPAGPQKPREVVPVTVTCFGSRQEALNQSRSAGPDQVTNYILYENTDLDPFGRALYLEGFNCTVGSIINVSDFNNITSSLERGTCGQITLYDGSGATGDWEIYYGTVDWVGSYMDNRTSSVSLP